jgi:hypothetical protein
MASLWTMSQHTYGRPTIRDLCLLSEEPGDLHDDDILHGLCSACQQLTTFEKHPNISRIHHSSFANLLKAATLGCRLCEFLLRQPLAYQKANHPIEGRISLSPVSHPENTSLVDIYGGLERFLTRLELAVAHGKCRNLLK